MKKKNKGDTSLLSSQPGAHLLSLFKLISTRVNNKHSNEIKKEKK